VKEKKKERRIRDVKRMKARAKQVYHITMVNRWVPDCGAYREALRRYIKHAEYLAVCSCTQCGNPRKKMRGRDQRTLQEIKFDMRLNEW
jgi:hypothetical protein